MSSRFCNRVKRLRVCSASITHNASKRNYGIMELEERFGSNFKKIQELDLENATPLEKKMHTFITRIQKSTTLNDTVLIHETEIAQTNNMMDQTKDKTKSKNKKDAKDASGGISKPNMGKIVQSAYNWNPYHGRATKKNKEMQHDHLDAIPDEYKQAGWGMQPAPITSSPQIHKMFPNTDILKNIISDGQRVFDIGHLLTNPLQELGYRDANVAQGRDYNVLERALQPYSANIVEEWHGSQAIDSQKESKPYSQPINELTQQQMVMRRLKKRAELSYAENASLPPFKFGFEDVPIFIHQQRNYHSPDKLGDAKRTRELTAKASIFLKYIFPNIHDNKQVATACKLIGGKFYNAKTTKLTFLCTNHYFYSDNEKQIVEWIGKLIAEIERLAEYIGDNKEMTWEGYNNVYNEECNDDIIYKKWNKHRWKQKMLSLPVHVRSNYNLYQNGNRMNKLTNYLDLMYDKAFIDAGNILQSEGPKKGTATEYYQGYIPTMDEIISDDIDNILPNKPANYMIDKIMDTKEEIKGRFNIVYPDKPAKGERKIPFGLNSCYLMPSSDKQFEDVKNAFHYPLSQPFTGLRLRKFKLTPWTNSAMMKLYRYEKNRLGMKLIFGDEQFKRATMKKIEEAEAERNKQKIKSKQQKLQQGRKRNRKKYQARQHIFELKAIKKKKGQQKEQNEAEDNPLFNYLGSKKIAKQFQSQISDIST